MKKFLFPVVAMLLMAACTNEDEPALTINNQVEFLPAQYMPTTKALSGTAFTYDSFGVYAWAAGTASDYFMPNETVTLQSGKWLPSTTYYWPKESTVDFISYSPRVEATDTRVKIEPAKITYTGWTIATPTVAADGSISTTGYAAANDLMYADKVVGMSSKTNALGADVVDGSSNQYKTVPAFFRHALSRLNVKVAQKFMKKDVTEPSGSTTKYKWTVKVNSATLKGVDTKGDLVLNLSSTANTDLEYSYPWEKPANELWSNVGTPMADLSMGSCTIGVDYTSLLTGLYVVPQALTSAKQQITLNMTVTTFRSTDGTEPSKYLEETLERTVNLLVPTKLESWKMNQDVTYNLVIVPTADPSDPGDDPDDPDLDDIVITFDPAVADWSIVGATATIEL